MGFWVLLLGSDGRTVFHSHIIPYFVTEDAIPDFDSLNGLNNLLNPALFAVYRLLHGMAADLLEASINKN